MIYIIINLIEQRSEVYSYIKNYVYINMCARARIKY